jgi:hypothetical protein
MDVHCVLCVVGSELLTIFCMNLMLQSLNHKRELFMKCFIVTFIISWLFGTFKKGFKKDLEVDDLYTTLAEHRSDYLGDRLER